METQTDPPPAPPATVSAEVQAEMAAAPMPAVRDVGLQADPPAEADERAEAFELANRVEAQALGRLRDRHERAAATVAYLGQLVAKHSHLSADLDHRAAAVDEASHVARKEAALMRLAELDDEETQLTRLIEEREQASAARLAQSAMKVATSPFAKMHTTKMAASPPPMMPSYGYQQHQHHQRHSDLHNFNEHFDGVEAAAASRLSAGSVASSNTVSSRRQTWQRPRS
jgi:hypothetical protein